MLDLHQSKMVDTLPWLHIIQQYQAVLIFITLTFLFLFFLFRRLPKFDANLMQIASVWGVHGHEKLPIIWSSVMGEQKFHTILMTTKKRDSLTSIK